MPLGRIRRTRIEQAPPLPDLNFGRYVAAYRDAAPGAFVSIPINPQPEWRMELVKRREIPSPK
jgi:hypothetical protein